MDKLAVVVPAYNEQATIENTLDALTRQSEAPSRIIVVNNASTDDTPNIVADRYPEITLLHESTKGTGYAANTGFRYAIDETEATIVMRTDADTVPSDSWVEAGKHYLTREHRKQLISGSVKPLRDDYWRRYDEVALPASYVAYRMGVSALKISPWPLRVARGANMAIRSQAFQEAGGFPACNIGELDDDIELTKRVYAAFGFNALANVRGMEVRTSMRRIRKIGYSGLVGYYLNFGLQPLQQKRTRLTGGEIDVR
jgi:glycosyltransferase involved in cell wall biosynthesis